MRVISGVSRGRLLKAVPGIGTRPTTDKVKEAIYSMIGPFFDGGLVLDLFAGTGGLGIEALSRGMERAIFVDLDKASVAVIRENLQKTGLAEKAEVYQNDAIRALKALAKRDICFDLVFLDPPYRIKNVEQLLQLLQEKRLLQAGAIILVEHESAYSCAETVGCCRLRKHVVYGDTAITIFEFQEEV